MIAPQAIGAEDAGNGDDERVDEARLRGAHVVDAAQERRLPEIATHRDDVGEGRAQRQRDEGGHAQELAQHAAERLAREGVGARRIGRPARRIDDRHQEHERGQHARHADAHERPAPADLLARPAAVDHAPASPTSEPMLSSDIARARRSGGT